MAKTAVAQWFESLGYEMVKVKEVSHSEVVGALLSVGPADGSSPPLALLHVFDFREAAPTETRDAAREIKLLTKLKHPYIARIVDHVIADGFLCVRTEFRGCPDSVRGQIDRARRSRHRFCESQILEWFTSCMLAVKYLHGHHLVHRDLRSGSVLLDHRGMVKLGGLAVGKVLAHASCAQAQAGMSYCSSPEVCAGQPHQSTADVWSMGCVLFETCALRVPFDAPSASQLVAKIIEGSPDVELPAQYSSSLRQLCGDMTAREPAQRPSAGEVLRREIVQEAVRALREKATYKEQASRHRGAKDTEVQGSSTIRRHTGDQLEYYSNRRGAWLPASVIDVDGEGSILIDRRPNTWISLPQQAAIIRTCGPSGASAADTYGGELTAREAPCAACEGGPGVDTASTRFTSSSMLASSASQQSLPGHGRSAGDLVEYYSGKRGTWLPARVVDVDAEGRVRIDLKPNAWMSPTQQARKIRARGPSGNSAPVARSGEHSAAARPQGDTCGGTLGGDITPKHSASSSALAPSPRRLGWRALPAQPGSGPEAPTLSGDGGAEGHIQPTSSHGRGGPAGDVTPKRSAGLSGSGGAEGHTHPTSGHGRGGPAGDVTPRRPAGSLVFDSSSPRHVGLQALPAQRGSTARVPALTGHGGAQDAVHPTGRHGGGGSPTACPTALANAGERLPQVAAAKSAAPSSPRAQHLPVLAVQGDGPTSAFGSSGAPLRQQRRRVAEVDAALPVLASRSGGAAPALAKDDMTPLERRQVCEASKSIGGRPGAEHLHSSLPPRYWGVSKLQLQDIEGDVKGAGLLNQTPSEFPAYDQMLFDTVGPNMHQLNDQFIRPRTGPSATDNPIPLASYALSLNHEGGLDCDLFISHCWDEGFFEFCAAVLKVWPADCVGAYICCFANPQHLDIGALVKSPKDSPFHRVLSSLPRCMLLVSNSTAPIHSRLWCCYEAFCAWQLNGALAPLAPNGRQVDVLDLVPEDCAICIRIAGDPLNLLPDEKCRRDAAQKITRYRAAVRRQMHKRTADLQSSLMVAQRQLIALLNEIDLDINHARCTHESDEKSIRAEIHGHELSVNHMIKKHLFDALTADE